MTQGSSSCLPLRYQCSEQSLKALLTSFSLRCFFKNHKFKHNFNASVQRYPDRGCKASCASMKIKNSLAKEPAQRLIRGHLLLNPAY